MSVKKIINNFCVITFVTALCWVTDAAADFKLNMTPGVTETSHMVYGLHMRALWMVTIIGALVFAVMIYSLVTHRKSKGAVPAKFHHSTRLELIWTIIPIIILVVFAFPATKGLIKMENTGNADMTVKITGYQWKWRYDYLDEGFGFFSALAEDSSKASQLDSGIDVNSVDHYLQNVDNPLVLPVNKKVRLLTTSNDVIHSWWVPALGWKRDAIPGFINDNWTEISKPGIYRGQCAELCGQGHGFMPIVVKAVPEAEYVAWVKQMKAKQAEAAAGVNRTWTRHELMERGRQIYSTTCVACHQPNGQGLPPTFPALSGSKVVTGPISGHIDVVVHGRPGTAMQAFGKQLNAADIAAVITYERNSFGNKDGDMVQPSDVKAVEDKK
jgi:cytochrome c oxidase subunit 2